MRASGPKRNGNQFALLAESDSPYELNPSKKHKLVSPIFADQYPELPTSSSFKNPRFVVISSTDKDKPISSLNPFLLKKGIEGISKEFEHVSQLRDGNLLVLVKSKKSLADTCPISVKLHDQLNSTKGVVFAPCLINVPDKEIITEMQSQGVTDVYKFNKTENGKQRPSGLLLFTFDLLNPPKSLEIGLFNAKVTEYIPNPMRCKSFQLLGHTSKRCTNDPTCVNCSLPPHSPELCTRTMCANCKSPHPSSSKDCTEYKIAKEIITIKTKKKCSMSEAKRLYGLQNPKNTIPIIDSFAKRTIQQKSPSNIIATNSPQKQNNETNSLSANKPNLSTQSFEKTTSINPPLPVINTSFSKTQPIEQESKKITAINNISINNTTQKDQQTISQPKNINTNTLSPISHLTSNLINDKKYFMDTSSMDDDDP